MQPIERIARERMKKAIGSGKVFGKGGLGVQKYMDLFESLIWFFRRLVKRLWLYRKHSFNLLFISSLIYQIDPHLFWLQKWVFTYISTWCNHWLLYSPGVWENMNGYGMLPFLNGIPLPFISQGDGSALLGNMDGLSLVCRWGVSLPVATLFSEDESQF